MKAHVLYGIGDLRYAEIEEPKLKDGWALVQVKACGICSSDIPRIFYNGTYRFPLIPGHEFSGLIKAVKNESDKQWLNKRVSVFPLIPCFSCDFCQHAQYELCENYNYLGSRCDGGFAEYVAVPLWNVIEIPQEISYIEGALFEPFAVALHCLRQAHISENRNVLVVGSGMIAFAVAQWAKYFKCNDVYMLGHSEYKRKIADELGINYATNISDINSSFDIVVEAVGSNDALSNAITKVKPTGKLVLMGNPKEDINLQKQVYWRILRKQLNLIGTWNSSYKTEESDWDLLRSAMAAGAIKGTPLVSHIFPQEELQKGLSIMKNGTEAYCKVMTIWNE